LLSPWATYYSHAHAICRTPELLTPVPWRAWLAFVALGIIWGVPYFFIKVALRELAPFFVAWGRIVLATSILLPLAWHRGGLRGLAAHRGAIVAFALAEFVIPFSVICIGERWISSSVTGILIAGVPLTVIVASRFFGVHEPLGTWRLLGLAVGLLGVVALVGLGSIGGALGWAGVGCMVIATLGYAIGPLIIQRYLAGLDAMGCLAAALLVASLLLLAPALLARPTHLPTGAALGSIAVLGLLCTAVAMLLMFYLVGHAGAARAAVITYINPAVATLLGVLLLDERLGVGGYLGFALILVGSWLSTRGSPPAAAVRAAAPG
jgi:drug/metabolite transporter (DMT)-like permease